MTQESPLEGRLHPDETMPGLGHAPEAVQSLKQAMRRARFDDAERVGALADLRESKVGRLEMLKDALKPLLAQIPDDIDLFDIGLMPGPTPRLFVDMIGFVEMGRDARLYRFLQDTRHSRVTIAETSDIDKIVQAITDYVARRMLEREKALAADALAAETPDAAAAPATGAALAPAEAVPTERRGAAKRLFGWSGIVFAFVIDLLGAITFFAILAFAGWLLWNHFHG